MGSFIQTSSGTKAANTTSIYSGTQPVDINSTSSSMRAFSISSTVSNLQNINVTSTPSSTQPISNLETSSGNKAAHTTSISSGTQPVGINSTFSSARALSSSSTLSNLQNFNTTSIPSKTQPISSLLTPSTFQTVNVIPTASGILPINPNACGSIQPYQQPNASSWATVKTDEWFNAWWTKNLGKFDPTYGFAESFGYMYTGNPNYDCQDNGADDNCQVDPCGNAVLNSAGSSMQPAYYVLKSMTHLRQYFKALEEAFVNAGIQAALVKDNWAYTYYVDKNDFSSTELSILIIALTTVINIVAAFACPLGEAAAMSVNAAAAAGGGLLYIDRFLSAPENSDDTPKKAAQMGATLASLFQKGMASFTQANNVLMKGLQFGNQDIRGYLSGGAYLTGPNPNISAITQTAETLLASVAINQLWKQQKIFIMGGGPCDDSGGIGNGPQEAKLCKNNQAWYLFYWQEYLGQIHLGKKQWGNVAAPPGMDTLASQGITVQVIQSTV